MRARRLTKKIGVEPGSFVVLIFGVEVPSERGGTPMFLPLRGCPPPPTKVKEKDRRKFLGTTKQHGRWGGKTTDPEGKGRRAAPARTTHEKCQRKK